MTPQELFSALSKRSSSRTPGGVEAFDERRCVNFDQAFTIKFPLSRMSQIHEKGLLYKHCYVQEFFTEKTIQ